MSVKTPAADSVPPPVPPTAPADSEVIKRIFANWKARQERVKSFQTRWTTHVVRKSRSGSPDQILRRGLWVDGDDRFRSERSLVGSGKNNWDHIALGQSTWHGTTDMILEWLHEPTDAPQGGVRQDTSRRTLDDIESKVPLLVFRPLHRLIGSQASQFRVVTQHAIVDGVHCVKLERSRTGTAAVEHCWVDPARDDLPLLWESTLHGSLVWRVAIQYRRVRKYDLMQPEPPFPWVPERWTCHYQSLPLALECQASEFDVRTELSVNQRLPEWMFQVDFPARTLLFDETTRRQYAISADGSRTPARPFESVPSPRFRRVLEKPSDSLFDPLPLKEAVDSLSRNIRIPLEIDERAFRDAGISPNVEVQCDVDGLTVLEKIRWLTAQCPKPITLVEQDGKLVLKPRNRRQSDLSRHLAASPTQERSLKTPSPS
ncbi:MAG TPA: hypothetical protein VHX68_09950 [Planctomycetaceae bacterium]|nr:hypothetical protein [Planctomycetaceae bacterium]